MARFYRSGRNSHVLLARQRCRSEPGITDRDYREASVIIPAIAAETSTMTKNRLFRSDITLLERGSLAG
jgi:hypothetical protein